jgi:hypothetical protein
MHANELSRKDGMKRLLALLLLIPALAFAQAQRTDNAGTQPVFNRVFGADQFITGNTVNIAVTASDQTLTLTQTIPATKGCQIRLVNSGTQTVFVRFDGTTVTTSNGWPILPNTVEVFDISPGAAVHVIAAATGSTLYATLGYGS